MQLYEFQVSQTTTTDLATEVLVEYSNDGVSWFSSEQVCRICFYLCLNIAKIFGIQGYPENRKKKE